jgi:zinc finger SWIM domain-containing protein 3
MPQLMTNMPQFHNKEEAKKFLINKAIREGRNIKVSKSDTIRLSFKCSDSNCTYNESVRLRSDNKWNLNSNNPIHTCATVSHPRSANSNWIAERLDAVIQTAERITPRVAAGILRDDEITRPRYRQVLRGIHKAIDAAYGLEKDGFSYTKKYLSLLSVQSPQSIVSFEEDDGRFKRLFVFPCACINSLSYLRRIFVLDACHIKTKYGGQLLFLVSKDAQNNIIYLSFGVVPIEDTENWTWFLNHVKSAFERVIGIQRIMFVSDRDKGLVPSVASVFPGSHHGFCVWHIVQNVKSNFRATEAVRNKIFVAAKALTTEAFDEAMNYIRVNAII